MSKPQQIRTPDWIGFDDTKWKRQKLSGWEYAKCPFCGVTCDIPTNYCPECGANMESVVISDGDESPEEREAKQEWEKVLKKLREGTV